MPIETHLPDWLSEAVAGLTTGDLVAWMGIYAQDAVHEFPFAAADSPRRLEGREQIASYLARIPERVRFGSLEDVRSRETGGEVIVEARGRHRQASDGKAFDVSYVWIITRYDGQVTRFRDYMSPMQTVAQH